jgi:hypothetical protein
MCASLHHHCTLTPGVRVLLAADPTTSRLMIYPPATGQINPGTNPALKVAKPRRLTSTRQAIPDAQLAEINQIAATTGNDPALDTSHPTDLHPLAQTHNPHLGRTQLRLRHPARAGHTNAPTAGTTATYVKATLPEIAQALSTLTGEPHPLANS